MYNNHFNKIMTYEVAHYIVKERVHSLDGHEDDWHMEPAVIARDVYDKFPYMQEYIDYTSQIDCEDLVDAAFDYIELGK